MTSRRGAPRVGAGDGAWAGRDIVACITFRRDLPDPGHDLLRAFRTGDRHAVRRVVAAVAAMLDERPDTAPPGTLAVVVPGHLVGTVNAPCRALIEALAADRAWVVAEPGMLRRVLDGPEGKTFGSRDPATESGTLAWDTAALAASGAACLLLVDDVVASGATMRAAAAALPPEWRRRVRMLAAFRSSTG